MTTVLCTSRALLAASVAASATVFWFTPFLGLPDVCRLVCLLACAAPLLLLGKKAKAFPQGCGPGSGRQDAGSASGAGEARPRRGAGEGCWRATYEDPLRWALPGSGELRANTGRVEAWENDLAVGTCTVMHQPTHEPWRKATSEYPWAWHLAGRRRLWEVRFQMRFKQAPQGRFCLGISLCNYVRVSGLARQVQRGMVKMLRSVVGDLYHSVGDDPATVDGELEPPCFTFPVWAVDQVVVSNPGEEPDLLGDFEGIGFQRTKGIKAFIREMGRISGEWRTDRVYTFCMWGPSQMLDCMRWELLLPGMRLDCNRLCGSPPIFVELYDLVGATDQDPRRLPSRKRHYFHCAMWSMQRPPAIDVVAMMRQGAVKPTQGCDGSIAAPACATGRDRSVQASPCPEGSARPAARKAAVSSSRCLVWCGR